jgi:hypothetical protein
MFMSVKFISCLYVALKYVCEEVYSNSIYLACYLFMNLLITSVKANTEMISSLKSMVIKKESELTFIKYY